MNTEVKREKIIKDILKYRRAYTKKISGKELRNYYENRFRKLLTEQDRFLRLHGKKTYGTFSLEIMPYPYADSTLRKRVIDIIKETLTYIDTDKLEFELKVLKGEF